MTVDEHDYQTKKNQAVRFLTRRRQGESFSLRFKGSPDGSPRAWICKIVNRLIQDIGDNGVVEFMPRMEGTTLHAIIAPTKKPEIQMPPAAPKAKPAEAPVAAAAAPQA